VVNANTKTKDDPYGTLPNTGVTRGTLSNEGVRMGALLNIEK